MFRVIIISILTLYRMRMQVNRTILGQMSIEENVYIWHHQSAKFAHLYVSIMIYYKLSHHAASYAFNWENVNLVLPVFDGDHCEIDLVNECEGMPCGDNSMCQNEIDQRTCLCPDNMALIEDR